MATATGTPARRPVMNGLLAPPPGGRAPPRSAARAPAARPRRVLDVGGLQLACAVLDGRLVASTGLDGIAQVRAAAPSLEDAAAYGSTIGRTPPRVGSLVFLDFSQLLRLGEQTGLNDSRAYQAVKADLRRVQAVGGSTSRAGDVTTATLVLSIP